MIALALRERSASCTISVAMKIGVFTDVHANLEAATTILDALAAIGVDLVVHTGDAVGMGPDPAETLDYLLERQVILIRGNHEDSIRHRLHENPPAWMHPDEIDHERWASEQLSASNQDAIDRMPELIRYRHGVHSVVLQHAGFDSDGTLVSDAEEYERWKTRASGEHAAPDIIVFGHDHRPHDEECGGTRFVSPGSSGCTRSDETCFGIIDLQIDGTSYERRTQPYARSRTIERFEARNVPGRESILRIFFGITTS